VDANAKVAPDASNALFVIDMVGSFASREVDQVRTVPRWENGAAEPKAAFDLRVDPPQARTVTLGMLPASVR
jgi:hypothetical protein